LYDTLAGVPSRVPEGLDGTHSMHAPRQFGRGQARLYCCVQTHTLGPQSPGVAGFNNVRPAGVPAVAL
jgi:hypothetical protein